MIVSWNDLLTPLVNIDRETLWILPLGTIETNNYRNLFGEYLDKSDAQIQDKVDVAWHCSTGGSQLVANPASDGEEWFAMALLFASARWGNGDVIFDYRDQAQEILGTMLHKNEEDNGIAMNMFDPRSDGHADFRFDAGRTLSNVAVDYAWFAGDSWEVGQSNRVLDFLTSQGIDTYPNQYSLGGEPLSGDHSTGLIAMAAVAALAADPEIGKPFVQALWDTSIPSGKWRYYDGCSTC